MVVGSASRVEGAVVAGGVRVDAECLWYAVSSAERRSIRLPKATERGPHADNRTRTFDGPEAFRAASGHEMHVCMANLSSLAMMFSGVPAGVP